MGGWEEIKAGATIESSDVIGLNFTNQNPLPSCSFYIISSCPVQKKIVFIVTDTDKVCPSCLNTAAFEKVQKNTLFINNRRGNIR